MAIIQFNAAQVAPQTAFEPIPNDWYNVMIDESGMKPTKDGAGAYLELRLAVMDGKFVNRKLFTRLNIQNNNATAVEIAFGQLSAICHAVGVMQVNDSAELHGKPFMAKVVVRPPKDGYEASNECKGFRAVGADGTAPAGNPAAGNPAANGGASPAWAQKKPAKKPVEKKADPVVEDDDAEEKALEAQLAAAKQKKAEKKAALIKELEEAEAEDNVEEASITPVEEASKQVVEPEPVPVVEQPDEADAAGDDEQPPWMRKK